MLDRFHKPVFGAQTDDMHNTHNGELPGHIRAEDYDYRPDANTGRPDKDTVPHERLATDEEVAAMGNDSVVRKETILSQRHHSQNEV